MVMVQYGIWSNCNNNCDFCLRELRTPMSKELILEDLESIKNNILHIDWIDKFSDGISLLGGELYFMEDEDIRASFLDLIDVIIEKVLKVSPNPNVKYSSVSNGLYNPEFLFKVIDKIVDAVGIKHIDMNFSYDLKYRFKTEERRLLCLENIHKFKERYNYEVGVQMILTQYFIDGVLNKTFDFRKFLDEDLKGCVLSFLYPHPINTGVKLEDFNFKRNDFLNFLIHCKTNFPREYENFVSSTKYSAIYKYTGIKDKSVRNNKEIYNTLQPILSDGKEIINYTCNKKHSKLYQCYSDSDRCMLCDILNIDC
jgi:hypothetical protein